MATVKKPESASSPRKAAKKATASGTSTRSRAAAAASKAKAVDKSAGKPGAKAAAKPATKSAKKPAKQPATKSASKSGSKLAGRTSAGHSSGSRKRAAGSGKSASGGAGFEFPGGMFGAGLEDASSAFAKLIPTLGSAHISPDILKKLQEEYLQRWQQLLSSASEHAAPGLPDRRFSHESWHDNGPFTWTAALYLLNAEFMQRLAASVEADRETKDRLSFATQQWVDMLSPSNFLATNPEVQQKLLETRGESLRVGLENLFDDLQQGRIRQTDETAFQIGVNVATSPGAVVFRNELIELIQYAPSTPKVGARPLLLVPPFINKFYIMDLQPEGSFVANAVSKGHTVFLVSWRNAGPELGHLSWDDYLTLGIFKAIDVTRQISGASTINALGFCVGGTILATGIAALAARGERPVHSMTLMTTLLDFAEPGTLGVFVDEAAVQLREQTIGRGGLLRGKDLATTFSFLRPNDLVWNYYVNNYLKGEQPPAFDLLYWNSDSTNLPGPMYAWYLRHMYLQNELKIPGRLVCAGQPIDLRRINMPTYVFGAREDHIVLWRAAFSGACLLAGPVRFVLGASGHIAGAINPASKNKRSYWTGPAPAGEPEVWLENATEQPGSWWNDWTDWLEAHRGESVAAPVSPGSKQYPPLESAPGGYVKVRAE
jgi:polyhydroxyalkanoate synthase